MGAVPSGACPVGFSARHANGGVLLNVSPAEKTPGLAYDIHLVPRDGRGITGAMVTLHGLAGHHVIPAGEQDTKAAGESRESFRLALHSDGRSLFSSVVRLSRLTGVTSVELNEISYADGTRWREAAASPCAVVPDGYMLVAGGH